MAIIFLFRYFRSIEGPNFKRLWCLLPFIVLIFAMAQSNHVQSYFNGSNTTGTMKIYSRQGLFELMSVSDRANSGGIIAIFFDFI